MKKYLVVRYRIKDYEQWKKAFDANEDLHREYGLKGGTIYRDISDPLLLTVCVEFEDDKRIREFMHSPRLKDAMSQGGVIGESTMFLLEEVAPIRELASAAAPSEMSEAEEYWEF